MKKQIYLHFSEAQPKFDKVKVSASRVKKQIYFHFSETQPKFDKVKVSDFEVETIRKGIKKRFNAVAASNRKNETFN